MFFGSVRSKLEYGSQTWNVSNILLVLEGFKIVFEIQYGTYMPRGSNYLELVDTIHFDSLEMRRN